MKSFCCTVCDMGWIPLAVICFSHVHSSMGIWRKLIWWISFWMCLQRLLIYSSWRSQSSRASTMPEWKRTWHFWTSKQAQRLNRKHRSIATGSQKSLTDRLVLLYPFGYRWIPQLFRFGRLSLLRGLIPAFFVPGCLQNCPLQSERESQLTFPVQVIIRCLFICEFVFSERIKNDEINIGELYDGKI